jgi:hypothetical protein
MIYKKKWAKRPSLRSPRQREDPTSKKPLKRGSATTGCGAGLNQQPADYEPNELIRPLHPTPKLGTKYTTDHLSGQSNTRQQESPQYSGLSLYGTEEGTRTPTAYGHYHLKVACLPIPPPRQNAYCPSAAGTSVAAGADFCSSSTGTSSISASFF